MKKNLGTLDKAVRISAAVLISILYFANILSGAWAITLLTVAIVFIVTSFLSFCPLYSLFGISTLNKSQKT